MSVFVRVRGPTTHGAVWRLGPHHAVAVVSYLSRQWGPILYCSFPRVRSYRSPQAPGQGRLLGYGTLTFQHAESVQRVLQAVDQRHGLLRIPYGVPLEDPEAIACTSLADSARAFLASPSIRDTVATSAPLAPGTKSPIPCDHLLVTVERSERALRARSPQARADPSLLEQFDGFAGGLAERAAHYAREDRRRERQGKRKRPA